MEKSTIGFIGFSIIIIVGLVFVTESVRNVYSTAEDIDDVSLSGTEGFVYTQPETLDNVGQGITSLSSTSPNQTWLDFDGVNDNITLGDLDYYSPDVTGGMSVCFWSKIYENSTITRYFIGKGSANNYEYHIAYLNDETITANTYNFSGATCYNTNPSGSEFIVDQWRHYCMVYKNDSYLSLFINGYNIGDDTTCTSATKSVNKGAQLKIGVRDSGYLNGSIDNFVYYPYYITPKMVAEEYSKDQNYGDFGIPILVFQMHRYIANGEPISNAMNHSQLKSILEFLNNSGYSTITDVDYLNYTLGRINISNKSVMFIWDDNAVSEWISAAELMANYSMKSTVALTTSGMNQTEWNGVKNLIINYSWTVASHSDTHCIMSSEIQSGAIPCNITSEITGNMTTSYFKIIQNASFTPVSFVFPYNFNGINSTEEIRGMQECTKNYSMCWGNALGTQRRASFIYKNTNKTLNGLVRWATTNITNVSEIIFILNDTYSDKYVNLKLNENNGTVAYDSSGNSNNGTISGATWQTDGQTTSLTEGVDYSHTSDTFTLLNNDYLYSWIDTSYNYDSQTSDGNRNATVLRLAGIVIISSLLFFCYWFIKEQMGWIN